MRNAPALRSAAAITVILLLGVALRLSTWSAVFDGQSVNFHDGDSYFHLRRIEQILRDGSVPMFDPGLAFPDGQRLQWHGGYDLTIAALVGGVCGARSQRDCLESVAAFSTPVFGVFAIAAVLALGWVVAGRRTALGAALFFALWPFSAGSAALGMVDHHVFEPLLPSLWMIALARGRPLLAGSLCGLSLAVFPTALWPIAVTVLALVVERIWSARPGSAPNWLALQTLSAATLCAVPVVWSSAYAREFEPSATSLFHLATLAASTLLFALLELCLQRARRHPRRAAVGLLGLCGALCLMIAWPQLAVLLRFGGSEGLWAGAVQHVALGRGPIAIGVLCALATGLGGHAMRSGHRRGSPALVWLGLIEILLALGGIIQIRFLPVAAPFIAVVMAYALDNLGRSLETRLAREPMRTRGLGSMTLAALYGLALSPASEYAMRDRGPPSLADSTRLLRRFGQQRGTRPYGAVLSDWTYGHHILYFTGLPTVASPFILSGVDDANVAARVALLSETPGALYAAMERRRARYLLVSSVPSAALIARSVHRPLPLHPAVETLMGTSSADYRRLSLVDAEPNARLFMLDMPSAPRATR